MCCSRPGFPVHHPHPDLAQSHVLELVMPSNHLILCPPLLSYLQSFPASGSFFDEAKVLGLQLQHKAFQWIVRTDFFRIDWLDLLAIQGTLKSLLQHHSKKKKEKKKINSIALSFLYGLNLKSIHDYWKMIALTRQTIISKTMYLHFIMLSTFVIDFLPRSKCLLISWLQSPSAVILEPKKIKYVSVYIFSP